jgi:hypothetical protein
VGVPSSRKIERKTHEDVAGTGPCRSPIPEQADR